MQLYFSCLYELRINKEVLFVVCVAKKIPAVEEKLGKQPTPPVVVKKWTKEDAAACKIQKYVRRFLAKRQLAKRKKERADYEALMDKLEKEVLFVVILATVLLLILIL